MTQFRIYTEDKSRGGIEKLVAEQFDAFTIFAGTGYWRSLPEASLCIEIITEDTFIARGKVGKVATAIKALNNQEAVLVIEALVEATFV